MDRDPIRPLPEAAGGILSYFTRHGTAANLLLVLMVIVGLAAIPNMRTQFFPDTTSDNVRVAVKWDGASAEDVDDAIVQVMQPTLIGVDGVLEISSTTSEGSASITLEFEPGWDTVQGANDVLVALDTISDLPEDMDEPEIRTNRWRDRVTDVVISGPLDAVQLANFADELVARLYREGVTLTTIRGIAGPEMRVEVPSVELIAHDLTMAEIAAAIAAEVNSAPAGDVSGANARVRAGQAKRSVQDIEEIVLRRGADGTTLTIADVARVTRESLDRHRQYFVGENGAVSIRVDRSSSGDAIGVQAQVEKVAAELQATLPESTTVELIRTRTEAITGRLNILIENGLVGLALVVALLFLFLNARTAFWVAAGIPVAMLGAIALMYAGGLTINMVSLFGLIITLGIVVDDAIVVGEHADHRARTYGERPVVAAETAARRMAMPVFASTITTVIAFFGLTLVGGRFGTLIVDIPFTVIVVLLASLVECFLILPNHMAHALKTEAARPSRLRVALALASLAVVTGLLAFAVWYIGVGRLQASFAGAVPVIATVWAVLAGIFLLLPRRRKAEFVAHMGRESYDMPSFIVNHGFVWVRARVFRPLMAAVIWARYVVLSGVLVILASQLVLFIEREVPWRFFNAPEQGSITGNFAMVDGASRDDSLAMMREMQRALDEVAREYEAEHGANPVTFVLSEVGGNAGGGLSGVDGKDRDLLGGVSIELIDADLRPYSSFAFLADLQDRVARLPLVETISWRSWRSGPGEAALSVQFFGSSAEVLKSAAEDLKTAVAQFPEVSAVEDSLAYDKEEMILSLTPQGEALGFTIGDMSRVLRNRLNGIEAATYPDGLRTASVWVSLPETELSADFLDTMQMRTPAGDYVPLGDIVSVEVRTGFSQVKRENGLRVISVTGDIAEDNPARAGEIQRQLEAEILPRIAAERQVEFRLAGLSEQENRFLREAGAGFVLCLAGIYLALAWVFASWTRPVVVMAIIPFGLVGTIYGHYVWDVPMSMFTVVGLLGMTGIIVNDSIVLVTTIDRYRQDRGLSAAIIDGTADRLRPVLLTTLTTVMGLIPLLYEGSSQAQWLKPTVITLVYGLGFGMILVLLVVPALIAMQHDVGDLVRAMRQAMRARRATGLRGLVLGLWALILAWAAVTLGSVMLGAGLPALIGVLLPTFLAGSDLAEATLSQAFGVFLAGAAVVCISGYFVGAGVYSLQRRYARET